MIIMEHEKRATKVVHRHKKRLYSYSGGQATAAEIGRKIGLTEDAVRKRLKTQTVDELLVEGRRPRGLPAGHPNLRNQYSNLNGYNGE